MDKKSKIILSSIIVLAIVILASIISYRLFFGIDSTVPGIQLTNSDVVQIGQDINSESNLILYGSKEDVGDWFDLWLLERNGENWNSNAKHIQLTTEETHQLGGDFDNNDEHIVYLSREWDGTYRISVLQRNGKTWDNTALHIDIKGEFEENSSLGEGIPSFSWDGEMIVFPSSHNCLEINDGPSYNNLWLLKNNDTEWGLNDIAVQLTYTEDIEYNWPSFSPDNRYIMYEEDEDLWLLERNGNEWDSTCKNIRLTDNNYYQKEPSFSPDGKYIIYYSNEDGGKYSDIWLLERNGADWDATAKRIQITDSEINEGRQIISPDGEYILFSTWDEGPSGYNIHIMEFTTKGT